MLRINQSLLRMKQYLLWTRFWGWCGLFKNEKMEKFENTGQLSIKLWRFFEWNEYFFVKRN